MDFAYALNGYVYHTKYDNIDVIPPETLQHTGDNILATVKGLANAPELNDLQVSINNNNSLYLYEKLIPLIVFVFIGLCKQSKIDIL